jgi:hypothetical protein
VSKRVVATHKGSTVLTILSITTLEATGRVPGRLHSSVRALAAVPEEMALSSVVPVESKREMETEPASSLAPKGTHVMLPLPESGHTVVGVGAARDKVPTEVAQ